jgi:hypothetical protein
VRAKLVGAFLVVVFALGATTLAPVDSPVSTVEEAHAHSYLAAGTPSPYAWCIWRGTEYGFLPSWDYVASRMIHYGDAHVYQCRLYHPNPLSNLHWVCFQEVEWYGWQGLNLWFPEANGVGCPV